MRTGLVASTVTPGSTAPDESLTTPVMDPWADATAHGSGIRFQQTLEERTDRIGPLRGAARPADEFSVPGEQLRETRKIARVECAAVIHHQRVDRFLVLERL